MDASLSRIAARAPDIDKMRKQATSESMMLNLYHVRLPTTQSPPSADSIAGHDPSRQLLQAFNPWLLTHYQPACVGADGNCFFRSLSLTLYSTEAYHVLLRLLCVIEVLNNQHFYDNKDTAFYPPYKADIWLQLPEYADFVCSLCQLSSFCDMLSVLAASSVTQKAIQTLWPLAVNPGEMSPFTKLVLGRGVATCRRPVQILWSVTEYSGYPPNINHFVPLLECKSEPETVINCEETGDNNAQHDETSDTAVTPDVQLVHSTPVSNVSAEITTGIPLPSNRNLSLSACVEIMNAADASQTVQSVPNGIKSNVCFLVSNNENDTRLANGQKRVFYDDCGAWSHTRGFNSVIVGDSTKELFEKNGAVCDRKRVNGKEQLVPLNPQPQPSTVRRVTRYYYKLKRCAEYTKRITMLSGCPVYLCEYLGAFPVEVSSHGNCLSEGSEYVRIRPEVTESVKKQCMQTKAKPNQIYSNMVVDAENEASCPRNLKQVQNISAGVTANLISQKVRGTNNLADEMLTLCSLVAKNDFVRNVS